MRRHRGRRSLAVAFVGVCLLLGPGAIAGATRAGAAGTPRLEGAGSVDEAWLTGAGPGDSITLLRNGKPVANPANPGMADSLGSLIIRNLQPGVGYAWDDTRTGVTTGTFSVLAPGTNPAANSSLYKDQPMHQGLNYITMRDGIKLAATVRYPFGATCSAASPCPTVIEYSGYDTAGPTDPIPFVLAEALGEPCNNCGDPNLLPDSATYVGAVIARMAGFATVSLQMRGTGCSGGAFDLFGYPSDYDAYDAIEIVAHQDWVAHHKVGMVGISFSGLSQFPSAGTDPPGLAAIAAMSPTDDLFSTGYPGGIYNSGFAASWISQRIQDAKPAATLVGGRLSPLSPTPVTGVGQPWTYYEIDAELSATAVPSSACLADQALHGQSEDLATLVGPQMVAPGSGPGREPSLFNRRSMSRWAARIGVPVWVSGALQDDETGPQWPALLDALPRTDLVFASMINGDHIDSAGPRLMSRWLEFLDLYVADKVPSDPGGLADLFLDRFASTAADANGQGPLPPVRFTGAASLVLARAEFAGSIPRVWVLFDNGAGAAGPGNLQPTYGAGFSQWPPRGTIRQYFFYPGGGLGTSSPASEGSATFSVDPSARPATDLPAGDSPWASDPAWDWTTVPPADGIAFQTAPFTKDSTFVGPATVDLWVKSDAPIEDFQVTVTEVRPAQSQEVYVTSGFLRSSNQADLPDSTDLYTDPSYLASEAGTLSPTSYTLVRIPVDPVVNTFRAGTELRIVISAPGGDRPEWQFDTLDDGQSATVGLGGVAASALVVNQVAFVHPSSALPPCAVLRGEPCRAYQTEGNQS